MSIIKFVQINIYKGKYLDDLLRFLKEENPDFISMQEVTTNGFNLCSDKSINLFDLMRGKLKMDGVFNGDLKLTSDASSVFGNAVLSKHKIVKSNVRVLKQFRPVSLEELDGDSAFEIRPKIDRHLLDAQADYKGKSIHVLSWHGAWTAPPTDTEETMRQAQVVSNYLAHLAGPFILGGDLNNIIGSKTVGFIDRVAQNLMKGVKVKQTTHPRFHKIAPRGFLVDYIFCSTDFKLKSLRVPEVLISDHLPVVAELEF